MEANSRLSKALELVSLLLPISFGAICGIVRGSVDVVVLLPMYKLDTYAGARGFNPEFHQYASRMPCPCGLIMAYKIYQSLNLSNRDIACTGWNQQ